ncbi:hypothetical protein VIGAN_11158600 [Vigna angularis var. angularis]|uniref:Uncharacterized protein n=1 Tax=Vigna angularis var. angularis TaxID=157739 RepID=A0A0S3TB20_PHAAN|nr:hypothetical protein VIGAN_11158600 [Vigna angularis var. angularis]
MKKSCMDARLLHCHNIKGELGVQHFSNPTRFPSLSDPEYSSVNPRPRFRPLQATALPGTTVAVRRLPHIGRRATAFHKLFSGHGFKPPPSNRPPWIVVRRRDRCQPSLQLVLSLSSPRTPKLPTVVVMSRH